MKRGLLFALGLSAAAAAAIAACGGSGGGSALPGPVPPPASSAPSPSPSAVAPTPTPVPSMAASPFPSAPAPAATVAAKIYVANSGDDSILVFPANANGNATPMARITSASLSKVQYPYVDFAGKLYVTNAGNPPSGSMVVLPAGANGSTAPLATFQDPYYTRSAEGVFVDTLGDKYLADIDRVVEFAPSATTASSPTRDINGSFYTTYISGPYGMTQDNAGRIWLCGGSFIQEFDAGANGAAATKGIFGQATQLASCLGLAVDNGGFVYAANFNGANVTSYLDSQPMPCPSPGNPTCWANVPPTKVTTDAAMVHPWGLAIDLAKNMYVADYGANAVFVFAPTGGSAYVKTATIGGANTMLSAPKGIAVR